MQTRLEKPLYVYKYVVGIQQKDVYVDKLKLHQEWLESLLDGEHNHLQ